jgi:protein O-mannosyl-transferase
MVLPADPLQRWYGLGNKLLEQHHSPEAAICYRQVLKINSRFAYAWAYLGVACYQNGQDRDAVESWQKFLEFNSTEPQVLNNLALVLATAPDPSLRNGLKAVTLAELANRGAGGSNPEILSTLAAAYAEAGRYREASATARRALNLAQVGQNGKLSMAIENEIKLYDAGQPMRREK